MSRYTMEQRQALRDAEVGRNWTASQLAVYRISINSGFSNVLRVIEARSIPEPNSGCQIWEGNFRTPRPKQKGFYGAITVFGRERLVHRVVYEEFYGPLDAGQQVLHRCDVSLCVNIDHLFIGTNDQNHADKAAKDRGRKRLTHEQAVEMHRMAKMGISQHKIARHFHVCQPIVSRVISGIRRPLAREAFLKMEI